MNTIDKYKIRLLMNICYKKITGKDLYEEEKFFKGYKPYEYFKLDKEKK